MHVRKGWPSRMGLHFNKNDRAVLATANRQRAQGVLAQPIAAPPPKKIRAKYRPECLFGDRRGHAVESVHRDPQ